MICNCRAFPWPHKWLLSTRCKDQFDGRFDNRTYLRETREQHMAADARERAAEMRSGRFP